MEYSKEELEEFIAAITDRLGSGALDSKQYKELHQQRVAYRTRLRVLEGAK